jgi:hypothetical protein
VWGRPTVLEEQGRAEMRSPRRRYQSRTFT